MEKLNLRGTTHSASSKEDAPHGLLKNETEVEIIFGDNQFRKAGARPGQSLARGPIAGFSRPDARTSSLSS